MVISHKGRVGKTASGGRYPTLRKIRIFETGRYPSHTGIGKKVLKHIRTKGGGLKPRLFKAETANVWDTKNKKYIQAKIKIVVDNPANRHFVRRNIITKGSIIETELGKARVTSRPGQHGIVNAVLV